MKKLTVPAAQQQWGVLKGENAILPLKFKQKLCFCAESKHRKQFSLYSAGIAGKKLLLSLVVLTTVLSGCSKDTPPSVYGASEVGVVTTVKPGIVVSSRMVKLDKTRPADEAATAPISQTSSAFQKEGYEYVIQLEDGSIISIVQNEKIIFKNNQRVFVIYGKTTRVVADKT